MLRQLFLKMAPAEGDGGGSGGGGGNIASGGSGGGQGGGGDKGGGAGSGNAGGNGGAGNNDAGSGNGGQGGAGGGAATDWREALPEALRGESSLASFKSIEDLAKSYVSAQSLIGRDKVVLPTEKSSEADWEQFYAKAGRPASPDKYGLKIEGLDESGTKSLSDAAFKLGLSPRQLNGLVAWQQGVNKTQMESFQQQQLTAKREAKEKFVKELGGEDKFRVTFDRAADALAYTADREFIDFIDKSGLGEDPRVIKFFAGLADRMKEDGIKGQGGVQFGAQVQEIEGKIKALEADPAYCDGNHINHMNVVEQAHSLREVLVKVRSKG